MARASPMLSNVAAALLHSNLACGGQKQMVLETSGTETTTSDAESSSSTGDPVECPPPNTLEFVQISAGSDGTCGVTADQRIVCWGTPTSEPIPCEQFRTVQADPVSYICGITTDDRLLCWGEYPALQWVPPSVTCEEIALGGFVCCLGLDHKVDCFGPIGADALPDLPVPEDLEVVDIAVGSSHGCAIDLDGVVHCWGDGSSPEGPPPDWIGAHGDDGQGRPVPGVYVAIDASDNATCGLHPDGTVDCWGDVEGTLDRVPEVTLETISVGGKFACGLRPDGSIACWGDDFKGRASPPAGAFVQVDAGAAHACALREDGSVVCWGAGETEPPTSDSAGTTGSTSGDASSSSTHSSDSTANLSTSDSSSSSSESTTAGA